MEKEYTFVSREEKIEFKGTAYLADSIQGIVVALNGHSSADEEMLWKEITNRFPEVGIGVFNFGFPGSLCDSVLRKSELGLVVDHVEENIHPKIGLMSYARWASSIALSYTAANKEKINALVVVDAPYEGGWTPGNIKCPTLVIGSSREAKKISKKLHQARARQAEVIKNPSNSDIMDLSLKWFKVYLK